MAASGTVVQKRGGAGAAWTLVFLAPFIAEVLSGATKLSVIFAIVPEMMCWGCGALLIRELVRRWRGGWLSLLLMGLGLSIAEEFIIQQTSVAPLPFAGTLTAYGRAWGVNWIYFLFMLGFESVFVVLVPVAVTELIFPERGEQPWLRTRGMAIAGIVFLLGSWMAWYAWIKRARLIVFHLPAYYVPWPTILAGFAAIAALVLFAYLLRGAGTGVAPSRYAPPAWAVALVVLALGFPWYGLMAFVFISREPRVSFELVLAAGVAWGILAALLLGWWAQSPQWDNLHRWTASFAATLVCMAAGFLGSSTWLKIDLIGKAMLNVIAVVGFLMLLRRGLERGHGSAG